MRVQWASKASTDVIRLYEFLAGVNAPAAGRIVKSLVAAPAALVANPHIGERLGEFEPREVRRLLVGQYEMRYEIVESTIYIMRVWHTHEAR